MSSKRSFKKIINYASHFARNNFTTRLLLKSWGWCVTKWIFCNNFLKIEFTLPLPYIKCKKNPHIFETIQKLNKDPFYSFSTFMKIMFSLVWVMYVNKSVMCSKWYSINNMSVLPSLYITFLMYVILIDVKFLSYTLILQSFFDHQLKNVVSCWKKIRLSSTYI